MNLNIAYPGPKYSSLEPEEIDQRIEEARAKLGKRLIILGHHYQSDDIIKHADFVGDSLALSKSAAQTDAEFIVFCGVHFMAETADLLTDKEQRVFLPNITAGCPLASKADINTVTLVWQALLRRYGKGIVPVTYINSTIELKAFCGANEGIVCTSSNAEAVLKWAWNRQPRVLFFPDQHLGRNTAYKMGVSLDEMALVQRDGNLGDKDSNVRIFLWDGYCYVHQKFKIDYFRELRERYPNIKIIVHPECDFEVAQFADYGGSTEYIVKTVSNSPSGTIWAIGTEANLVFRLKKRNPQLEIVIPSIGYPRCMTMAMITPVHLLFQLESLLAGQLVNQVVVEDNYREPALLAINRMMEVSNVSSGTI